MNKKTTFLSCAVLMAVGLMFSSCKDDENPNTITPPTQLTATLTGGGEKPNSTTSAATGTFVGSLNANTRVLSYTVTYTGPFTSSLVAGHLHRIVPNATNGVGPVEIPFTSLTSPIIGTFQLANKNRVDSMKNGFYYANLHTTTYPLARFGGISRSNNGSGRFNPVYYYLNRKARPFSQSGLILIHPALLTLR